MAQPQNTATRLGFPATFKVSATGLPPLSYRWFSNGAPLASSNAPTLVVTNMQPSNAGNYWVVITNSQGALTSLVATLSVLEPVGFILQPQNQTVLVGDNVIFTVGVTGTPPYYFTWRKDNVTIVPLGAGSNTLILTNVQLTNAGSYRAGVTNLARSFLSNPAALTVLLDSDGDRMPDLWEIANGLNPNVNDADLDPDGDGMTNWQEYIAGTDPRDPLSYLKVDQISSGAGSAVFRFTAISNRTYTVLYRSNLSAGPWSSLTNISLRLTNHVETVIDSSAGAGSRYYRLATPALP